MRSVITPLPAQGTARERARQPSAIAIYYDLFTVSELIEILKKRAAGCEVVVTDRYAPEELIELAGLVTEMREVKQYYRQGIEAREGIEY